MSPELARETIVILVNNSNFFRGVLFAKGAWGRVGFPVKDENEQLLNLVKVLREIAEGLEEIK